MTVFGILFDWLHISLAIGIILIILFGFWLIKVIAETSSDEIKSLERNQAGDHYDMLQTYARETANELIGRDEQMFARNFEKLCDEWVEIESETKENKIQKLTQISEEFPYFADFDLNGTHTYVLAADGFSWNSDEDLWQHYEKIRKYMSLSGELLPAWTKSGGIFPDELAKVKEYCNRITDTKLLTHLHAAKNLYDTLRSYKYRHPPKDENDDDGHMENGQYSIKPIPSIAGVAYGVYVKEMDLYGKWDTFYDDDKTFISYFKSDPSFELEEEFRYLNCRFGLGLELNAIESYPNS